MCCVYVYVCGVCVWCVVWRNVCCVCAYMHACFILWDQAKMNHMYNITVLFSTCIVLSFTACLLDCLFALHSLGAEDGVFPNPWGRL